MAGENACLFQAILQQLMPTQSKANVKLWEAVTWTLENPRPQEAGIEVGVGAPGEPTMPVVRVQKMTPVDDPEVYLNIFEHMATAAGWAPQQWAMVLIPCLVRPACQVVDTLPAVDLNNYAKVRAATLQTLDLSPEAYHRSTSGQAITHGLLANRYGPQACAGYALTHRVRRK